jgi:S1-C subfamily serine protease
MRTSDVAPKWLLVVVVLCVLLATEWPPYPPVLGLWGRSDADGVFVTDVVSGGGAEAADLRPGDVVCTVNGYAVRSGRQVRDALRDKKPGETVAVEFVRDGQLHKVKVLLQARR